MVVPSPRRARLALCLGATTASAQSAVRTRIDNDAFNFWLGPWDRPDEEYSSGVRIAADWAGPAFWSKRFGHDAPGCAPERDRPRRRVERSALRADVRRGESARDASAARS